MDEAHLKYEQFKADILQWKNEHREEYSRFARLMTDGDINQYITIYMTVMKRLPEICHEWELLWDDDSVEDFGSIDLLMKENAVPKQIVELYKKQREEENSLSDTTPTTFWGKVKSFFNGNPKKQGITLSAPLVLSWLYYGKSFEAMVDMLQELARHPKAGKLGKRKCTLHTENLIEVSIKQGFRTRADWERHFSMSNAIEKGKIAEWAFQSVANEMEADNNYSHTTSDENSDTDIKPQRTAGKKKTQERPLIDYLDCEDKETVIQCIRHFVTVNTSAVHQALPFYVLKELRLVAGMHTAKEYSTGMTLQFPDLSSLKSESAIRQAVGFLKTAKHVIKDGKDQSAPLMESDENRELFQRLAQEIKDIIGTDKETDNTK